MCPTFFNSINLKPAQPISKHLIFFFNNLLQQLERENSVEMNEFPSRSPSKPPPNPMTSRGSPLASSSSSYKPEAFPIWLTGLL